MYRVVFALFVITFLLDLQETSNEKLRTKKNHLRKFGQLFINFLKWKSHSSLPRFILIIFVSESRWKYENTELYFRETKLVNGSIYTYNLHIVFDIIQCMTKDMVHILQIFSLKLLESYCSSAISIYIIENSRENLYF